MLLYIDLLRIRARSRHQSDKTAPHVSQTRMESSQRPFLQSNRLSSPTLDALIPRNASTASLASLGDSGGIWHATNAEIDLLSHRRAEEVGQTALHAPLLVVCLHQSSVSMFQPDHIQAAELGPTSGDQQMAAQQKAALAAFRSVPSQSPGGAADAGHAGAEISAILQRPPAEDPTADPQAPQQLQPPQSQYGLPPSSSASSLQAFGSGAMLQADSSQAMLQSHGSQAMMQSHGSQSMLPSHGSHDSLSGQLGGGANNHGTLPSHLPPLGQRPLSSAQQMPPHMVSEPTFPWARLDRGLLRMWIHEGRCTLPDEQSAAPDTVYAEVSFVIFILHVLAVSVFYATGDIHTCMRTSEDLQLNALCGGCNSCRRQTRSAGTFGSATLHLLWTGLP